MSLADRIGLAAGIIGVVFVIVFALAMWADGKATAIKEGIKRYYGRYF